MIQKGYMIYKIKFTLFLSLLGFLASCSNDPKSSSTDKLERQKHPMQIGSSFDREIDPLEQKFNSSIFKIRSEMSGTEGVATYLGEFGELKLFLTNKHIVNSDLDTCDKLISLVDVNNKIFLGCKDFIFSFQNLDISIIAMDVFAETEKDFDLKPVLFSTTAIDAKDNLTLRTIDNDLKALVIDQKSDCKYLDTLASYITDPFPNETEIAISTWSIPIGCDAKPGDSGAPIFGSSGMITGVLWGGSLKKEFVSSELLTKKIASKTAGLWQNFNFAVPSIYIKSELQAELNNIDENSLELFALKAFYESL